MDAFSVRQTRGGVWSSRRGQCEGEGVVNGGVEKVGGSKRGTREGKRGRRWKVNDQLGKKGEGWSQSATEGKREAVLNFVQLKNKRAGGEVGKIRTQREEGD